MTGTVGTAELIDDELVLVPVLETLSEVTQYQPPLLPETNTRSSII